MFQLHVSLAKSYTIVIVVEEVLTLVYTYFALTRINDFRTIWLLFAKNSVWLNTYHVPRKIHPTFPEPATCCLSMSIIMIKMLRFKPFHFYFVSVESESNAFVARISIFISLREAFDVREDRGSTKDEVKPCCN